MKNKNNINKLLAMSLSVVLVLVLATVAIIFLDNKVNSKEQESIGNDYFTASIKKHSGAMDKLKQQRIQEERKREIARVVAERKKREALAKKKEQERLARIAKLEKERQAERERLNKIAIAKTEKERKEKLAREQSKKKIASANNDNKKKIVSRSNSYKGDNVNLGTFNISAYGSNCFKCSGISASGVDLRGITSYKGHGIAAADWSVIPPYSIIEVEGYGTFIILDTGGKIKQKKLDLLMGSEAQSKSFGRQHLKVTLIRRGR